MQPQANNVACRVSGVSDLGLRFKLHTLILLSERSNEACKWFQSYFVSERRVTGHTGTLVNAHRACMFGSKLCLHTRTSASVDMIQSRLWATMTHLSDEVHPLVPASCPSLRHLCCFAFPDSEEGGRYAVHEHRFLPRQGLHCIRQLDDLVAVHSAHPGVHSPADSKWMRVNDLVVKSRSHMLFETKLALSLFLSFWSVSSWSVSCINRLC